MFVLNFKTIDRIIRLPLNRVKLYRINRSNCFGKYDALYQNADTIKNVQMTRQFYSSNVAKLVWLRILIHITLHIPFLKTKLSGMMCMYIGYIFVDTDFELVHEIKIT